MVIQSYPYFTVISLALSLELALSSILPATAISQYTHQQPLLPREIIAQRRARLRFKIPNIRPSRNLEGGAARGTCFSAQNPRITPILPLTPPEITQNAQPQVKVYPASTVAAQPKFLVHIPQTSAKTAKLILQDGQGDDIATGIFTLPSTPSVVRFALPANAPLLEVGKSYTWLVSIICDTGNANENDDASEVDNSGNPTAEGVVQRIQPPAMLANLEKVAPTEQPLLYAQADLWYDSVTALAELRSAKPSDLILKQDWQDLLKSVNHLDTVAEAPIAEATVIECCTPKNE